MRTQAGLSLKGPRSCPDLCSSSLNSVIYTKNSAWAFFCLGVSCPITIRGMPGKCAGCVCSKQHKAGVASCVASHSVLLNRSLPSCVHPFTSAGSWPPPSQASLLAVTCKGYQDHILVSPKPQNVESRLRRRQARGMFGGWAASISFNINTSFAKN